MSPLETRDHPRVSVPLSPPSQLLPERPCPDTRSLTPSRRSLLLSVPRGAALRFL